MYHLIIYVLTSLKEFEIFLLFPLAPHPHPHFKGCSPAALGTAQCCAGTGASAAFFGHPFRPAPATTHLEPLETMAPRLGCMWDRLGLEPGRSKTVGLTGTVIGAECQLSKPWAVSGAPPRLGTTGHRRGSAPLAAACALLQPGKPRPTDRGLA